MTNPRNPVEGYGNKVPECPFYTACLEVVVGKDWASFHCDECPFNQGDFETVSIAVDCPTDGTIPLDGGESPEDPIDPPESEQALIFVDFSNHAGLLNRLKELSVEEKRSVEEILIRSLKDHFDRVFGDQSTGERVQGIISDGYAKLVAETIATLWDDYMKTLKRELKQRALWAVKETALILETSESDIHYRATLGEIDTVEIGKGLRVKSSGLTISKNA